MKKFSMYEYATKSNTLLASQLDTLVDSVYGIFVKSYFFHGHGERLSQEILQTVARNKTNFTLSVRTCESWSEFSDEEKKIISSTQLAINKLDYVTNEAYQLSNLFKKVVGVNWHYNNGSNNRRTGDFRIDYGTFLLAMAKERLLPNLDCQLVACREKVYIKDYPIIVTDRIELRWDRDAMEEIHLSWRHFIPFNEFDNVPYCDSDDYICCLIKVVVILILSSLIGLPVICAASTPAIAVARLILFATVPVVVGAVGYFLYQYWPWNKSKNDWRD